MCAQSRNDILHSHFCTPLGEICTSTHIRRLVHIGRANDVHLQQWLAPDLNVTFGKEDQTLNAGLCDAASFKRGSSHGTLNTSRREAEIGAASILLIDTVTKLSFWVVLDVLLLSSGLLTATNQKITPCLSTHRVEIHWRLANHTQLDMSLL